MCYRYLLLFIFINISNGDQCKLNNRTDLFQTPSGECQSCLSYCNSQTNICLYANQLRRLCSSIYLVRNLRECEAKLTKEIVHSFLLTNPSYSNESTSSDNQPVCLFCGNSTRGLQCESCRHRPNGKQLSHLIELKSLTPTCFECSCSGQTYDCRTTVIDGCSCLSHLLDSNLVESNLYQCLSNRTNTNSQDQTLCRSKIHQQCQNCKRGYSGVTSERGHRCYKLLSVDTTQCFEFGNSLKTCSDGKEIVRSEDNQTISFEITPNYRNLNIRVLIGIQTGFIDVICSIRSSNFLIRNDQKIYYEDQSLTDIEPIIRDYDLTNEDLNFGILYSDPSEIVILRNLSSNHRLTILISPTNIDFTQDNLRCLLVDQPLSRKLSLDLTDPYSPSILTNSTSFSLSDYRAIYLTTSSSSSPIRTNGFIKIYQSRMNIDLFVFFSVFFSSFFLFLSIGICFWKVKFAYEIHRRRRTLKHEYHKRMARPFAKIQLLIKPSTVTSNDQENSQQLNSPVESSSVEIPLLLPSTRTDIDYSSHVVAVEPLRDQTNCYTTLLFHLPGDLSTQYRLCAGTTLAQLPNDYSNALNRARIEAESQRKNKKKRKSNGKKPKVLVKKSTTNPQQQQQQQQRRKQNHRHHHQQQQQPRTTLGP